MSTDTLELTRLDPDWSPALHTFFAALVDAGVDRHFHPHPFTNAEVTRLCAYKGLDLYYVLGDRTTVLAYGLLRGWDDGYDVPSLGVAVHPAHQRAGYGLLMMHF